VTPRHLIETFHLPTVKPYFLTVSGRVRRKRQRLTSNGTFERDAAGSSHHSLFSSVSPRHLRYGSRV
jgi:hypothetical protein